MIRVYLSGPIKKLKLSLDYTTIHLYSSTQKRRAKPAKERNMETLETLKVIELTEENKAPGFNCKVFAIQRMAMEELNKGLDEKFPQRIWKKLFAKDGYIAEYRNAAPLTAKQKQTAREIMRQHYQEKLGCEVRIVMKSYGCCEGGYNLYYPEAK